MKKDPDDIIKVSYKHLLVEEFVTLISGYIYVEEKSLLHNPKTIKMLRTSIMIVDCQIPA